MALAKGGSWPFFQPPTDKSVPPVIICRRLNADVVLCVHEY
ncbi:Hypothetical protein ETEE_1217 [Edwardsiella anguillarum ET080813]|uniref:Uncharacterized protein n=1 Tax=Edwardsiella anguillarum ET080813 TaxID=667120 RepID=A0A076LI01_9GAMM|nr:Hypothetical protein ETEE_1217 [Edwardsiella anguillarum ET080813]